MATRLIVDNAANFKLLPKPIH